MLRSLYLSVALVPTILFASAGLAAETDDIINQLLPKAQRPTPPVDAPVLTVQAATKDEILERLGTVLLTRSTGHKVTARQAITLMDGHEAENLAALRPLPSIQVAVAFQGSSDALAPESGPLLGTLASALTDEKLSPNRFVIGVHTNAVGSDDYNLSLSRLRAKAILDTLVTVHGLPRDRLYAMGFGRTAEVATDAGAPSERIRLVNLGNTAVMTTPPAAVVIPPTRPRDTTLSGSRTGKALVATRQPRAVHRRSRSEAPHKVAAAHPIRRSAHARPSVEFSEGEPGRHHRRAAGYFAPAYGRPSQDFDAPESTAWGGYDPSGGRSSNGSGSHGSGSSGGSSGGSASGGGSASSGGSSGGSGSGSSGGSSGGSGGSSGSGSSGGSGGSGGSSSGGSSSGGSSGGSSGSGSGGSHGWSDRRLKRGIARIGTSPSGLPIYSFRYVWGGPIMVGVMAQDLLTLRPEAVHVGPGGYFQIDYSRLDVRMMPLTTWRSLSADLAFTFGQ